MLVDCSNVGPAVECANLHYGDHTGGVLSGSGAHCCQLECCFVVVCMSLEKEGYKQLGIVGGVN